MEVLVAVVEVVDVLVELVVVVEEVVGVVEVVVLEVDGGGSVAHNSGVEFPFL